MGQIENTEGIKFQICRKSKSICFSHWIKSLKIVGVKTLPERTESEKLKPVLVYSLKPFKKYSESICLERKFYVLTELFPQLLDGFVWHFVQTFRVPRGWILANLVIPWGLHFLVSREKTITCIAMTFSTDVHALQACFLYVWRVWFYRSGHLFSTEMLHFYRYAVGNHFTFIKNKLIVQ